MVPKKTKPGTKTELLVEKEAQKIKASALQKEKFAQLQQQQELEMQLGISLLHDVICYYF